MISPWRRKPLWSVANEVRRVVEPSDLGQKVVHYSIPAVDATGTGKLEDSGEIRSAKLLLDGGEVLISKLNPRKSRVVHVLKSDYPKVSSTEFIGLRAGAELCPDFLAYYLQSETVRQELDSQVQSVTRSHQRVAPEDVLRLAALLPDIGEQRRIADFLDAETSRIDQLSSAKTRMLDLIRERQVARTSSLCFRGCESGKHVKESGIAPVGVIPSHWDVVRNKQILREVVELSEDGSEEMLTVSHLTGVTPRSEKTVYMFEAESTVGYKLCRPDDLVINTLWAWMGALGVSKYRGMVSPAYGVYRFTDEGDNPAYFDYVYRTPEYVTEMTRYSKGVWSSRLRLYPESFLALSVPRPPRSEQDEIVDSLRRRMEPEDRLVAKAEISLKLLAERRQALITAAVTGQVDVTTASGRNTTQGV